MSDPAQLKAAADYANQILKYADVFVGVAFLQSLAFCYRLSDNDFADKAITVPWLILCANVIAFAAYVFAIHFLFHMQIALDANNSPALLKAKETIQIGRYVIVTATTILAVFSFYFTRFTRRRSALTGRSKHRQTASEETK